MRIADFDLDHEVFLVAEVGNNHEGSYTLAEELVGLAAESGANAVKFQTFKTESYVSRRDEARFQRLKSFELSYSQFEKLSQVARKAGLIFMSTPFDLESAEFLNTIVPAFKISSGDNNFFPLLERVAGFGKPIFLSSGLTSLAEISQSKAFIEKIWQQKGIKQELVVLHCVSSYPTPPEQANLASIPCLQRKLQCRIGYSDHTMGIEAATLAAGLGACVIEKHFTKDHNFSSFRDHQLSADPKELAALAQKIKEVKTLLGKEEKVLQDCERDTRVAGRRSIVAKQDLPQGTLLKWDDLTWIRPSGGLPPGQESLIVGKRLSRQVRQGDVLTSDLFQEP